MESHTPIPSLQMLSLQHRRSSTSAHHNELTAPSNILQISHLHTESLPIHFLFVFQSSFGITSVYQHLDISQREYVLQHFQLESSLNSGAHDPDRVQLFWSKIRCRQCTR